MADGPGGEKTEQATSHKLEKARGKGQVPKSKEVTTVFVLLASFATLILMAPSMWERLMGMFYYYVWRIAEFDLTTPDLWPWFYTTMREVFILILPVSVVIMIVGVACNIYQTGGFIINSEAVNFKINRLNFINGLGQLLKPRKIMDALKATLQISAIFYLTYQVISDNLEDFVLMSEMEPIAIGLLALEIALELAFKILLLLIILSVFDFAFQKYVFMQDMRMTKQEIKDEHKQLDGDPKVKQRIRQIQAEQFKKRMLGNVPKADVIITNPTHLAIALVYNAELAAAPLILAKGADLLAMRIRDIAKENKIPLVENKPLAQALYKNVEVGETIPLEFYKAVAEVLSYVYRLKGKAPGGKR